MWTEKIFEHHPGFKFIENDTIFKGFFFMFIYKDFIIRDVITRIKDCLSFEKVNFIYFINMFIYNVLKNILLIINFYKNRV